MTYVLRNAHGYYLVGWLRHVEPVKRHNNPKGAIVFPNWDQADAAIIKANAFDRLESRWYGKWDMVPTDEVAGLKSGSRP